MSKELKRNKCLEEINYLAYHAQGGLEASGRYIKSLRQTQRSLDNDNDKKRYEYNIKRTMDKHLVSLQEAIVKSYGKSPNKKISASKGELIKMLATSDLSVREGKYSLVDVEGLNKFKILSKVVLLKDELLLPCKVRSENQQYRFNTQIIMSKYNVLAYADRGFEYETETSNINHNVLLNKVGKGIINNELLEKARSNRTSR